MLRETSVLLVNVSPESFQSISKTLLHSRQERHAAVNPTYKVYLPRNDPKSFLSLLKHRLCVLDVLSSSRLSHKQILR